MEPERAQRLNYKLKYNLTRPIISFDVINNRDNNKLDLILLRRLYHTINRPMRSVRNFSSITKLCKEFSRLSTVQHSPCKDLPIFFVNALICSRLSHLQEAIQADCDLLLPLERNYFILNYLNVLKSINIDRNISISTLNRWIPKKAALQINYNKNSSPGKNVKFSRNWS